MKHLLILLSIVLCGCNAPQEADRGELKYIWRNSVADGVPHRFSALNDGTEILTIGHHSHGDFILLIRYADEEEFTIINPKDAPEVQE